MDARTSAVASLGIGIGACTAVFTVIEAAYLAPLPYDEPDRLVEIWSTAEPRNLQRIDAVPAERVRRWLDAHFRILQAVAARAGTTLVLEEESPERVQGEVVSGGYFQMLGAAALVGRIFADSFTRAARRPPPGRTSGGAGTSSWRCRWGSR